MPPVAATVRGEPRLPASLPVHRALAARGVELGLLPDETPEDFELRLETALMALFRDTRDEADFAVLYDYAAPRVLAWTRAQSQRFPSGADAHELLQDTFVNVYRYAAGFNDEHARSFQAWSRRIAQNLARRAKSTTTASFQALPEGLQEPRDLGLDPLAGLVCDEERRALAISWAILLSEYAEAWSRLAGRDRQALELVEVRELSYADAARELGVRLSNMKMIVFRARRRIRARLAKRLRPAQMPVLGLAV